MKNGRVRRRNCNLREKDARHLLPVGRCATSSLFSWLFFPKKRNQNFLRSCSVRLSLLLATLLGPSVFRLSMAAATVAFNSAAASAKISQFSLLRLNLRPPLAASIRSPCLFSQLRFTTSSSSGKLRFFFLLFQI